MTVLADADCLVRGRTLPVRNGAVQRTAIRMLVVLALFGLVYGAVMGAFGGIGAGRWLQVIYSGLKVPLLLTGTFLIALPSFFVFNTLAGVREDFHDVVRALVAAQAGLAVCLAALAPLTGFWYLSCRNYQAAVLFNAIVFGIASLSGQWMLRQRYRPLIDRNVRHRILLRAWLVLYAFVGIQMGWLLRPFIGDPDMTPQFFRSETWGNAYVIVANMIWDLLTG